MAYTLGCEVRLWKGESVLHLMPESMVCRIDPLPMALFFNSYGIINVLRQGEFVFARLIRTEQLP